MKKYKLIKEYPGSPKLNTTVYLATEDNYMTNMENDFRLFPKKIVENYPEFWEEVVEKDYEILAIYNKTSSVILTDSNVQTWINNPFTRVNWDIHSIKKII